MTVKIAWAHWKHPVTGDISPQSARNYLKGAFGGTLTCPYAGCTAALKHVPEYQTLGSFTIPAHFARMPDAIHNRAAGCEFPNRDDGPEAEERAEQQNRLVRFLNE